MLWHDYAEELGRTVSETMRDVSYREFAHWLAYRKIKLDREAEAAGIHKRETIKGRDGALKLKGRLGL